MSKWRNESRAYSFGHSGSWGQIFDRKVIGVLCVMTALFSGGIALGVPLVSYLHIFPEFVFFYLLGKGCYRAGFETMIYPLVALCLGITFVFGVVLVGRFEDTWIVAEIGIFWMLGYRREKKGYR